MYEKGDNEVVMTYIVDEKYTDIASLSGGDAEQRRYLHAFLSSEAAGSFLNDLVAAGASFTIRFEGNTSGASESVSMSAAELKNLEEEGAGEDNDRTQLEPCGYGKPTGSIGNH